MFLSGDNTKFVHAESNPRSQFSLTMIALYDPTIIPIKAWQKSETCVRAKNTRL